MMTLKIPSMAQMNMISTRKSKILQFLLSEDWSPNLVSAVNEMFQKNPAEMIELEEIQQILFPNSSLFDFTTN
jgi:hypothetical protein